MPLNDTEQRKSFMSSLPTNACHYPFKAGMMMQGTDTTPCCRFHHRFLDDADKESLDIYEATFADIRHTMLANQWHPGCYKCHADEEIKGSSMRTEASDLFSDNTDTPKLEYLEIAVGRLCNLACVNCGPEFSHSWDKDTLALNIESQNYIDNLNVDQELNLDDFDITLLSDLNHLKVTGGEPFLHRQFMAFIVRLANADLASNINIEIFTNGTWYPEKLEHDALMRFKSISITVSLDGIGKLNDIMRYPSKWNDLESTISRWLELCNSHNHVIINIAPTINVINVAYMHELLEWASTHGINVITQTVFEPHHLSVTHWPNWFKRNLKELIDNQYQDSTAKKFKDMWDLISKMCKNNPLETVDNSNEYIENIERLNSHRGFTLADTPLFKRLVDAK